MKSARPKVAIDMADFISIKKHESIDQLARIESRLAAISGDDSEPVLPN